VKNTLTNVMVVSLFRINS